MRDARACARTHTSACTRTHERDNNDDNNNNDNDNHDNDNMINRLSLLCLVLLLVIVMLIVIVLASAPIYAHLDASTHFRRGMKRLGTLIELKLMNSSCSSLISC